MNRRRLEFEPLRDSMLAVGGNLDSKIHGSAVNLFGADASERRTIYGKIDRQDLPNLLRVFDIASPDQSAAKRVRTTVPQQSLFMMNNRFAIDQAKLIAERIENAVATKVDGQNGNKIDSQIETKIVLAYQLFFQREPAKEELELAARFLKPGESQANEENQLTKWQQFCQILLCTNEFEFID